jgi:hypothetical protein
VVWAGGIAGVRFAYVEPPPGMAMIFGISELIGCVSAFNQLSATPPMGGTALSRSGHWAHNHPTPRDSKCGDHVGCGPALGDLIAGPWRCRDAYSGTFAAIWSAMATAS